MPPDPNQEWDANGKPIPSSQPNAPAEWDANGKPIASPSTPAFTANPNGEGTYKMVGPDGSNVSVPFSQVRGAQSQRYQVVGDDAARYQKDASGASSPSPNDGFISSWGKQLGLNSQTPSLKDALLSGIEGPAGAAIKGIVNQGKQSAQQVLAARAASDPNQQGGGNRWQALQHLITAVPIVGPALVNAADQVRVAPGDTDSSYGHQLMQTITSPGTMGTLVGASAQLAPLALGGLDTALPDRPVVGEIPSLSRAGDMHAQLNQNLANQNVPLSSTLGPLQRATEIAGRGGSMPKSVSDLLTRSQSPIEMTYPEARDYQSNLSDLSAQDLMGMNKKMSGAIKQVRGGLFDDIQNAADQGGMGQDYADAMKASRQAYAVQNAGKFLGKYATKAALTGAGLYEAHNLLNGVTGGSK